MPLDIPETAEEVIDRAKVDVRRSWAGSNPFLKNSAIGALVTGYANRVFDFYIQLKEGIRQCFPDTATDQFLERWGAIFGTVRLPATKSSGSVVLIGNPGIPIPLGTVFTSGGQLFTSTAASNLDNKLRLNTQTIERSGTTATVTTFTPHGMASNVTVEISGADQPEYNKTTLVNVINETQYSYDVTGSPATPATGFIITNAIFANVPVESNEFQDSANDVNVNLELDTTISLQSPIAFVENNGAVGADDIGGGTDAETDTDLRSRVVGRIQNPIAHFNVASIESKAREVNGVTRVFVEETTPDVGQVTIYFMRDNDDDPIPSGSEVDDVKNSILEIKPANTIDADVFVLAPTAVPAAFTFTDLSPNTIEMQTAISANLAQFFSEQTTVSVDVTQEQYIAAIQNTVDASGAVVSSFTLSDPAGDIAITSGQIATLGTVTYP